MRSFTRSFSIVSSIILSMGAIAAAQADEGKEGEGGSFDQAVPAVSQALEIGVGGGYTQGAGDVGKSAATVHDLSGPGATVELKVGYRVIPSLAFGAYGSLAQFSAGDTLADGTDVRSATAGVFADWHFRPDRSVDPWLGLSSGWRGLWLVPDSGKNTSLQGWEIVRLQAGLDYRISPEVAIAPVVGAGLNVFLSHDDPTTTDYQNVTDPRANVFFFGGLQARFDVLGQTSAGRGQAIQASR
jgi:hypothetical protein